MKSNLKQTELDMFEEHILSCLFQDAHYPRVNLFFRAFITTDKINEVIIKFESFVSPLLTDKGHIDGKKFRDAISQYLPFMKNVEIDDFRMIEVSRALEPLLLFAGTKLQ